MRELIDQHLSERECIYCRRDIRDCRCPFDHRRHGEVLHLRHARVVKFDHRRKGGVSRRELERMMRTPKGT